MNKILRLIPPDIVKNLNIHQRRYLINLLQENPDAPLPILISQKNGIAKYRVIDRNIIGGQNEKIYEIDIRDGNPTVYVHNSKIFDADTNFELGSKIEKNIIDKNVDKSIGIEVGVKVNTMRVGVEKHSLLEDGNATIYSWDVGALNANANYKKGSDGFGIGANLDIFNADGTVIYKKAPKTSFIKGNLSYTQEKVSVGLSFGVSVGAEVNFTKLDSEVKTKALIGGNASLGTEDLTHTLTGDEQKKLYDEELSRLDELINSTTDPEEKAKLQQLRDITSRNAEKCVTNSDLAEAINNLKQILEKVNMSSAKI